MTTYTEQIIWGILKSSFTKQLMEASSKSPYPLKNAVSVEMPDYMIRSPNTLLRNTKGELALSKNINI